MFPRQFFRLMITNGYVFNWKRPFRGITAFSFFVHPNPTPTRTTRVLYLKRLPPAQVLEKDASKLTRSSTNQNAQHISSPFTLFISYSTNSCFAGLLFLFFSCSFNFFCIRKEEQRQLTPFYRHSHFFSLGGRVCIRVITSFNLLHVPCFILIICPCSKFPSSLACLF